MAQIDFLGDEVTGGGFRLIGMRLHTASPESIDATFARLREESDLVLITAEYASWLVPETLDDGLRAGAPPVVVVPDVGATVTLPGIEARIRTALGIST